MLDLAQLAQDAINTLVPVLTLAAAKAGEGFLSEPGAKLFNWLQEKVTGSPSAEPLARSLDRALAEPRNPRRLRLLQLQIEDLADKDPNFRQQLEAILKSIATEKSTTQTATQTGDNNKLAQASGKNINIQIG